VPNADGRQVERMRKTVEAIGTDLTMVSAYVAERNKYAWNFLKDRDTLERPYILYCHLGQMFRNKPCDGDVVFRLKWFEIGYNSIGISIRFTRNGGAHKLDIPFPPGMWNEEVRKHHEEVSQRDFSARGEITPSGITLTWHRYDGEDWVPYVNHVLPLSVISEPAEVVVYDKEGNESEPLEMGISPEASEYILELN
jgi:hypothetical protein